MFENFLKIFNTKYQVKTVANIGAPSSVVWEYLTNPDLIKNYFYGVEVITTWQQGCPIIYKGTWQDKPYEDKGKILEIIPKRLIIIDYWSPLSNKPDKPENYQKVSYILEESESGNTKLTIVQDDIPNEKLRKQNEDGWSYVLKTLKEQIESR